MEIANRQKKKDLLILYNISAAFIYIPILVLNFAGAISSPVMWVLCAIFVTTVSAIIMIHLAETDEGVEEYKVQRGVAVKTFAFIFISVGIHFFSKVWN